MTKLHSHSGFTLIEILIATGILVMVGVAAIGIERQFMGSAGVNKHKLQATALAQEGVSVARAISNDKLLNPNDSAFPGLPASGIYYIKTTDNTLQPCPVHNGVSCDKDDTGDWNKPQNGVKFTRTITIP